MLTVRNILIALLCGSPVILLWDRLTLQGLVAGVAAVALVIAARTLRPGETEFLISVIRPPLLVAAVPALWVLLQALPLGVLAHPIWQSAETALQHPIGGSISADPGASIIALGRYLSITAVAFLCAAVAVDRKRAEWILFALSVAVTIISLIIIMQHLFFPGVWLAEFARTQAIDCAGLGTVIASAACIHAFERQEAHNRNLQRSISIAPRTFVPCGGALAICGTALILGANRELLFATGYGFLAFACIVIIRRFGLGLLGIAGLAVPALGVAILLAATHTTQRGASVALAFAGELPPSLTALNQRMLDDAPLVGTGAGTFVALSPIYREIDDPPSGPTAATAAGAFAIELGKPMLWLIAAATAGFIIMLLKASLQRGRDSFYAAMGGSCLITLFLLAFTNAGLLGTSTGLIAAAAIGLAFAQSRSRTVQT
jgi:hypothetical protein